MSDDSGDDEDDEDKMKDAEHGDFMEVRFFASRTPLRRAARRSLRRCAAATRAPQPALRTPRRRR